MPAVIIVVGANIMTANSDIYLIILYVCKANGVAQARRWRLPYVTLATANWLLHSQTADLLMSKPSWLVHHPGASG